MDYYGLLFLYYLKGLSGKSVLRLFFNVGAGGTEQLLPENTSTPTTTPILADIQYPDGLRTDQYFTYRETPTTVSNKARIKTIKGNTLVWNQLVQNGNFADGTNGWTRRYVGNISASDNILTYSYTGSTEISNWQTEVKTPPINLPANHKVIILFDIKPNGAIGYNQHVAMVVNTVSDIVYFEVSPSTIPDGAWTHCTYYGSFNKDIDALQLRMAGTNITNGFTANLKNVQVFDLTKMFGTGNEPTTVEEFTSIFSLPYYSYNQGTLLSFNGNGIKTVGKNILVDSGFLRGVLGWNTSPSDSDIVSNNAYITSPFIPIPQGVSQITISAVKGNIVRYWEADGNFNGLYFYGNHPNQGETITRTLSQGCRYIRISIGQDGLAILPSDYGTVVYGQIEFGNQATSYEPYTSSTLSLPISTYFPNGMKSAGSVYDELTESKAITRIGSVDLGTLVWAIEGESQTFFTDSLRGIIKPAAWSSEIVNAICPLYGTSYGRDVYAKIARYCLGTDGNGRIYIYDPSRETLTAEQFKTAMQGVYLYYELATPTETPITTEDANEALSLLMGKSVSSSNANQLINIITKGE